MQTCHEPISEPTDALQRFLEQSAIHLGLDQAASGRGPEQEDGF